MAVKEEADECLFYCKFEKQIAAWPMWPTIVGMLSWLFEAFKRDSKISIANGASKKERKKRILQLQICA